MSIDAAKAFWERIKSDEAFTRQINEFKTYKEAETFIRNAGYIFSKKEFYQLTDELSDDELDAVTGGFILLDELA